MAYLVHFVILLKKVRRSDTTEPQKKGIATKNTNFVFLPEVIYYILGVLPFFWVQFSKLLTTSFSNNFSLFELLKLFSFLNNVGHVWFIILIFEPSCYTQYPIIRNGDQR